MDLNQVKKESLTLIKKAKAAILTTIDLDGNPITRAMFNLRNNDQFPEFEEFFDKQEDKFVVYIGTNTASSKIEHIHANPAINIYFCEPEIFCGLMLGGKAEFVNDMSIKRTVWLDWWDKYYLKGVEDPDYSLFLLHPNQGRFYQKLTNTVFNPQELK